MTSYDVASVVLPARRHGALRSGGGAGVARGGGGGSGHGGAGAAVALRAVRRGGGGGLHSFISQLDLSRL